MQLKILQLDPRFMVCLCGCTELQGTMPVHALVTKLCVCSYVDLGYAYHESGKGGGSDHITCTQLMLIQRGVSNEWNATRDISVAMETCLGHHNSKQILV